MANPSNIFQLKITLNGIKPKIWRTILVKSSVSLNQLHEIIQIAMGWENSHMYTFNIDGIEYADKQFELDNSKSDTAKLNKLIQKKSKFTYTYDFGDDWEHLILVEEVLPFDKTIQTPFCIKAVSACPPEDCGGAWGYADRVKIMAGKDGERKNDAIDFLGEDFDPTYVDIDAINQELAKMK